MYDTCGVVIANISTLLNWCMRYSPLNSLCWPAQATISEKVAQFAFLRTINISNRSNTAANKRSENYGQNKQPDGSSERQRRAFNTSYGKRTQDNKRQQNIRSGNKTALNKLNGSDGNLLHPTKKAMKKRASDCIARKPKTRVLSLLRYK